MTKENARGATHDAFAKISVLIDTLCDTDLVAAQGDDKNCKVECMTDAVGLLVKARIALNKAYHNKL